MFSSTWENNVIVILYVMNSMQSNNVRIKRKEQLLVRIGSMLLVWVLLAGALIILLLTVVMTTMVAAPVSSDKDYYKWEQPTKLLYGIVWTAWTQWHRLLQRLVCSVDLCIGSKAEGSSCRLEKRRIKNEYNQLRQRLVPGCNAM